MYLEATVVDKDGKELEIIYGDYPSLDGLDVGLKIPLSKFNGDNSYTAGEYEIMSRELTKNRDTTQVDPEKVQPMIKMSLKKIS